MKIRPHHFTMIEVLTAIALTLVIGWMVNLAFNNTSMACRKITATLELQAQGEMVMNLIGADFRNLSQWTMCHANNPYIQEHELKFGMLMPTYRSAFFPNLASKRDVIAAGTTVAGGGDYGMGNVYAFWDEVNTSTFRNEQRGVEWRFMAGISNEYGAGITNLFTAKPAPPAKGYPNGIPRLLIKRNFGAVNDHAYGSSFAETTVSSIDQSGRNETLDATKLSYYVTAANIRDFRMDGFENATPIRQEKSPYYYTLQPELYYSSLASSRGLGVAVLAGFPLRSPRKTNGVISHYFTISFFITNAPMMDTNPDNGVVEAVLSPRCVAAIADQEQRERRQAITHRYIWAYFQRVFATQ